VQATAVLVVADRATGGGAFPRRAPAGFARPVSVFDPNGRGPGSNAAAAKAAFVERGPGRRDVAGLEAFQRRVAENRPAPPATVAGGPRSPFRLWRRESVSDSCGLPDEAVKQAVVPHRSA